MSRQHTQLIGKAKELEVASRFTTHGFLVYIPIVDLGADLVVGDPQMKRFVPVQVKFQARTARYTRT